MFFVYLSKISQKFYTRLAWHTQPLMSSSFELAGWRTWNYHFRYDKIMENVEQLLAFFIVILVKFGLLRQRNQHVGAISSQIKNRRTYRPFNKITPDIVKGRYDIESGFTYRPQCSLIFNSFYVLISKKCWFSCILACIWSAGAIWPLMCVRISAKKSNIITIIKQDN